LKVTEQNVQNTDCNWLRRCRQDSLYVSYKSVTDPSIFQ